MALDTLLSHVRPAVARHPLPLALGTFVLSETPLFALIRSQAFALRTSLTRTPTTTHIHVQSNLLV